MGLIALFVLALSYLVLLLLLRSVVLPLKAVLMNLLSVGAAYGVLVAVFQLGWIDGFLGFQSDGYVDALTPPLVLAIVFGLSMDYEVFLLCRIRERWAATGDSRSAVAEGLQASAKTITSAALIMTCVFAVFVAHGRAVDPAARRRLRGRDRARRDARAARARARRDGAARRLELVAPPPARAPAPGRRDRAGARRPALSASRIPEISSMNLG